MMATKPPIIPIRPIDFDHAKRAVDEFAAERNVPTHVFPIEAVGPVHKREGALSAIPAVHVEPVTRAVRKFTVELPDYVIEAVLARALTARPRQTARFVVLQALQQLGIEIDQQDMVQDGRRRGGRSIDRT